MGCPYGHHMGHDGYCIEGCPDFFTINFVTGKCVYEDYTYMVNAKYGYVVGIVIVVLVILIILFIIWNVYLFPKRKSLEIESMLAVALAQIHTLDNVKSKREKVTLGVGSNEENIRDWIKEIWKNYAIAARTKKDGYLRRHEFLRFVKNSFKAATFTYKFTEDEFCQLYKRFALLDGKINKFAMYKFLEDLKNAAPPDISIGTEEAGSQIDHMRMSTYSNKKEDEPNQKSEVEDSLKMESRHFPMDNLNTIYGGSPQPNQQDTLDTSKLLLNKVDEKDTIDRIC